MYHLGEAQFQCATNLISRTCGETIYGFSMFVRNPAPAIVATFEPIKQDVIAGDPSGAAGRAAFMAAEALVGSKGAGTAASAAANTARAAREAATAAATTKAIEESARAAAMARDLSKSVRSRPTMVTVGVHPPSGKVFYGYSGQHTTVPWNLRGTVPEQSVPGIRHNVSPCNCGEVNVFSQAFNQGIDPSELIFMSRRVKDDVPMSMCENCTSWAPGR